MRIILFILLCLFSISSWADDVDDKICLIRISPTDNSSGGSGTGFFIEDNTIVTAYHVIEEYVDNGTPIRVEYKDKIYNNVYVLGQEKYEDLAFLGVDIPGESWFNISDADPMGDENLVVTGFAKGRWFNRVSKGRFLSRFIATMFPETNKQSFTQFSTSNLVEGGMSGGPLLNEKGEVVGVLTGQTTSHSDSLYTGREHIKKMFDKLFKGKDE